MLALMTIFVIGTVSMTFVFAESDTLSASSSDERPDANVQWDEKSTFTTSGTAVARVVDHYMNMDSNKVETLTVDVYTEKNEENPELTIAVTETNADTGIFQGTVFFSETKKSEGNTLHVVDEETIAVEYRYSSVPGSGEIDIEVGHEVTIQNSQRESEIRNAGEGGHMDTGLVASNASNSFKPSVTLDRDIYPVPFGDIRDFEDLVSSTPDGRSLFPIHATAIVTGKLQESDALATGDLILHIRINDDNFDVSAQNEDEISQDINDNTVGPLKISISRDSQKVVLGYAGGSTPNQNGLIDVGDDNPDTARQLGPVSEVAPDAGIFELDFAVRYTDGPSNPNCPATAAFASLNTAASTPQGSEESRFDVPSPENENYCIMNGDVLTVEYIYLDESGNTISVATDAATFELRDGKLESDKLAYIPGSDAILTLTDPDLDLDNDAAETYTLDLIEWDSAAATLTMGELGGEAPAFDPEPSHLRETGDSTGVFQIVVAIPEALQENNLERGEEIILEYTDWNPSSARYVGEEDEDVNLTIYSSNFGATVELDKEVYSWTDKVYITVVSPFHNLDSDAVDIIGATQPYTITMRTTDSSIENYKLVETGTNTGIFTGEIILTGFSHDADGNVTTSNVDDGGGNDVTPVTSGLGPVDGFLQTSNDDGLYVQFEYSEDETIVGYAEIQWNTGETQWLEDSYSPTGTGVVRVIDPDMNWNPDEVDNFDVDVWSDSDAGGIDLTVTETNEATGIFEGTVFFSTTDESSGHRLRVYEGDTIYAEYEDNTLPEPYTIQDELDITKTSMIIKEATDLSATDMSSSSDTFKKTSSKKYMPPSKQIMQGILMDEITCQNNMVLIVKYNDSPACVKSETKTKLIERVGWDKQIVDKKILQQQKPSSVDNIAQTLTEQNNTVTADNDVATTSPVQLDRDVYPIPFGTPQDFAGTSGDSSVPDGRSMLPIHLTGMSGTGIAGDTIGFDAGEFIPQGDLVIYVTISDPDLNLSSDKVDSISENRDDLPAAGPLKVSIVRGNSSDDIVVLGYAGGDGSNSNNGNTENGLIDVGDNNPENTRHLGPISETAPNSGIFAFDLPIRYTDGPASERCPETIMYSGLIDSNLDGDSDDQIDRFDEPHKNPYCIMQGDMIKIEYTATDASGFTNTVVDSATFELRNGVLQSDRDVYIIGSDLTLALTEHDFNLDSKRIEEYDLDLIEWDSDAATVTIGDADGQTSSFDPEPAVFKETGKDTGIFEVQIVTPDELDGDLLERGEEIILEYTDWSPSDADFVGDEDEDVNLTIYTSNFGATIKLDKKLYNLGDTVHITVVSPNHNLNSDLPEEIGNTAPYTVKVSTRNFALENYILFETGNDTGIFTGEVTLVGPDDGQTTQGSGPTDGLLEANSDDDGITVSFEFSEDETVVGSALVQAS